MENAFRAKTIPVYFDLYKFRDYSDVRINGKTYIIADQKDILSKIVHPNLGEFYPIHSVEYFERNSTRFDDGAFLERILRWYDKFLKTNGFRKAFDNDAISNILDFCREFGMPIIDIGNEKTKEIREKFFFDAERFFHMMQGVYILFDSLRDCQGSDQEQKELSIIRLTNFSCGVHICVAWSEKAKNIQQFLVADSLPDIAKYQLLYFFSNNYPLKKCANPACGNPIINSRANMKYCSLACKQAHYRIRKQEKMKAGD